MKTTNEVKHTPGLRCKNCRWINEADSIKGTSFMGVGLCPLHAAAPDLLDASKKIVEVFTRRGELVTKEQGFIIGELKDAIDKASGRI